MGYYDSKGCWREPGESYYDAKGVWREPGQGKFKSFKKANLIAVAL